MRDEVPMSPTIAASRALCDDARHSRGRMMRACTRLLWGLIASTCAFASVNAQEARYPVTIIAPGKGPFTFPQGYQTPWDKIEIAVTEKMSPNLFVLHGSQGLDPAHPDASGGRAMVLFGP